MAGTGSSTDDRSRPAIPNHKITNEVDFQVVTKGPRQIAGAYFYLLLDWLVTYAYQVALDFIQLPQLYTDLKRPAGADFTSYTWGSALKSLIKQPAGQPAYTT